MTENTELNVNRPLILQDGKMAKKKTPQRKEGKPPPLCKSIILADNAIIEQGTGKVSIYGIFSGFFLPDFPGFTREAAAYLELVDGIGRYEVTVEIHDLQEDKVVAKASGLAVEFSERLQRRGLIIKIPPIRLEHSGKYDVVVLADAREIESQQFIAQKIERQGD